MKMEITFSHFTTFFHRHNRGDYFSRENLEALYNYLEALYEGEYELDVIELCGSYSEMAVDEIIRHYDLNNAEAKELDSLLDAEEVMEWLEGFGLNVINVDTALKALIVAE